MEQVSQAVETEAAGAGVAGDMTDFADTLYDGQPCMNGRPKRNARPELMQQWDQAAMDFLTSIPGTPEGAEKRKEFFEISRKCREAGLLPVKS